MKNSNTSKNELVKNSEPVLYILMRSDMRSMNAGKGMAQAAHAATAFEHKVSREELSDYQTALYEKWSNSTSQGFGTKIVLDSGDEFKIASQLREALFNAPEAIVDVIHDPSYPVTDGSVTHLLPLNTCAYIFVDRNVWKPNLSLHY